MIVKMTSISQRSYKATSSRLSQWNAGANETRYLFITRVPTTSSSSTSSFDIFDIIFAFVRKYCYIIITLANSTSNFGPLGCNFTPSDISRRFVGFFPVLVIGSVAVGYWLSDLS